MICGLDLGCYVAPAWDTFIGWLLSFIPYGSHGLVFLAGVIVGAALGWKGIAVVVSVLVAMRLLPDKVPVETNEIFPDPDRPRKGRRRFDPDTNTWK